MNPTGFKAFWGSTSETWDLGLEAAAVPGAVNEKKEKLHELVCSNLKVLASLNKENKGSKCLFSQEGKVTADNSTLYRFSAGLIKNFDYYAGTKLSSTEIDKGIDNLPTFTAGLKGHTLEVLDINDKELLKNALEGLAQLKTAYSGQNSNIVDIAIVDLNNSLKTLEMEEKRLELEEKRKAEEEWQKYSTNLMDTILPQMFNKIGAYDLHQIQSNILKEVKENRISPEDVVKKISSYIFEDLEREKAVDQFKFSIFDDNQYLKQKYESNLNNLLNYYSNEGITILKNKLDTLSNVTKECFLNSLYLYFEDSNNSFLELIKKESALNEDLSKARLSNASPEEISNLVNNINVIKNEINRLTKERETFAEKIKNTILTYKEPPYFSERYYFDKKDYLLFYPSLKSKFGGFNLDTALHYKPIYIMKEAFRNIWPQEKFISKLMDNLDFVFIVKKEDQEIEKLKTKIKSLISQNFYPNAPDNYRYAEPYLNILFNFCINENLSAFHHWCSDKTNKAKFENFVKRISSLDKNFVEFPYSQKNEKTILEIIRRLDDEVIMFNKIIYS